MSQLTTDLASIFADPIGKVPVVSGAFSTYGVMEWEDVPTDDGNGWVLKKEQAVIVSTAWVATASLAVGGTISVDGVSYRLRELRKVDVGATTRVVVA